MKILKILSVRFRTIGLQTPKGRKPIAIDRQQEVIRLVKSGMPKASIAKQLGVGEASVYRILKKSENSGKNEMQTTFNP